MYGSNRDIVMWLKLISAGIKDKTFNIIKSMYNNYQSHVMVNGVLSEPFQCYVGVHQGESLSLFLFSLFLNDMEKVFFENSSSGITLGDLELRFFYFMQMILCFFQCLVMDYKML